MTEREAGLYWVRDRLLAGNIDDEGYVAGRVGWTIARYFPKGGPDHGGFFVLLEATENAMRFEGDGLLIEAGERIEPPRPPQAGDDA